tara:strand:- start:78 stop:737 length:660 start_codon:yes stop_codon:yes gene_type:complete
MNPKNRLRRALVKSAELSWLEQRRLIAKMGLNPATVTVKKDLPHWIQAHAMPDSGLVRVGKNTPDSVLAHELGHLTHKASDLEMSLARLGNALKPVATYLPALMATLAASESAVSKAAPYVGALASAPKLVTEGLASYRGAKALSDIKPEAGLVPLILAQLSYPAGLLIPGVAAPIAIRRTKAEKEQQELERQKSREELKDLLRAQKSSNLEETLTGVT